MREGYLVLCSDWLPYYDLRDVVKLVPVLILLVDIPIQRLELWTSWYSDVQGLGSEEGLEIEQIVVVAVHDVRQQLAGQAMQVGHH